MKFSTVQITGTAYGPMIHFGVSSNRIAELNSKLKSMEASTHGVLFTSSSGNQLLVPWYNISSAVVLSESSEKETPSVGRRASK